MAINLKGVIPSPTNLANSYLFSESLEVISSTPYNPSTSTVDFLGGKDTLTTAITVPTSANPAPAATPVKGLSIQTGARMFMGLGDDDVNLSIFGGSHSRGSIGLANNGSFYADSTSATAGGRDRLIINVLSDAATGIANTGLIDMGAGGDSILVTAGNNPLDLGGALDPFSAANNYGTLNSGTIRTGSGDDLFRSDAVGATSYGVYNKASGVIDLGAGSDKLVCSVEDTKTDPANGGGAGSAGLYNEASAKIQTGLGSDRVEGISTNHGGFGIFNLGTIDTTQAVDNATSRDDSAKDIIVGDAITGLSTIPVEGYVNGGSGIFNNGIIRTGGGGDVVDAISGGFGGSGQGQVYLGAGRDSLLGFGAGSFYGEADIDTLTLSPGSYTISYATFGPGNIRPTTARSSVNATVTEASAPGVAMNIYGFEGIGGSGALAGLHFVDDLDPAKLLRSFTINANPLTGLGDVSAVVFAA